MNIGPGSWCEKNREEDQKVLAFILNHDFAGVNGVIGST
jgi:hypothetical protein